jgi:hypothetical protein
VNDRFRIEISLATMLIALGLTVMLIPWIP